MLWFLFSQDQFRRSPVVVKRMNCDSLFLQTSVADFPQTYLLFHFHYKSNFDVKYTVTTFKNLSVLTQRKVVLL